MKNPSLTAALAHIFLTSSMAVGVLATACCAQVKYGTRTVVADIPFTFTSDSDIMPPGRYRVVQTDQHLLVLRSEDMKHIHYMSTTAVQRFEMAGRSKLVFHRYGNQYFLFQVWSAGNSDGMQVGKCHAEKEMLRAQNNPQPTNAEVASSSMPQH